MPATASLLPIPISSPQLYKPKRKSKPPQQPLRRNRLTCSAMDPLAAAARLLWGRSLPPPFLISTVRSAWSSTWHLMMRQLAPSSSSGSYSRPPSPFPSVPHPPPRRLRLYAALPCPWAHRALIVRALKGLESSIPVSVATPGLDGSWEFSGGDEVTGKPTLREVYKMRPGGYDGRATVPMLWDVERGDVVCNESYGIIEFMNEVGEGMDLAPEDVRGEMEKWNQLIYPNVNNGVYRCGFSQSQEAYDAAVSDLFATLDMLDDHLAKSRYLCGNILTLADICLFTTLIRFDLVYNVLFKCTKKKLVEYSNIHGYMRDIFQIPKVAATCNFQAIMDGYFRILFPLNPGSICPVIPSVCELESLNKPHGRASLSLMAKAG